MALEKTKGPTLGVPFAHGLDEANQEQVILVALHPDSPGIGGGGGGEGGVAENVNVKFMDGITSTPVSNVKPLPVTLAAAVVAVSNAALGAVNNAAEHDPDAASATIPALLRGILASLLEYDSLNNPLPVGFGSYARSYTYTGDDKVETETVNGPGGIWVKTYTYTDGNLTAISGWVED